MRVAILGCGPTGLFAAHACAEAKIRFDIFSKKRKSELFGSQYLHEPVPGIMDYTEGEQVRYVNIGTPEQYRRKTHGKYWDGIIAPEDFETEHIAWNIREAYDRLWRAYADQIHDYEISTRFDAEGKIDFDRKHPYWRVAYDLDINDYDLVVSTVPRNIWATEREEYIYSTGWALGDAPEKGIFVPIQATDMTIECNGDPGVPYNRLSKVFGYTTMEWPAHSPKPDGASMLIKPLKYKKPILDVNPADDERWLHVGRYGQWQKGIVTTDAYKSVSRQLAKLLRG